MRFLANRAELLPIARRCSQTIGHYFESRERSCVLMEADAQSNTVTFTARSRSCTLQVRQPCRVEQGGKALLFASVFQRILESFADEATFIASDDSRIEVRNAKALFEFPLLDVSKYPVPETPSPVMLLDCSGFAEISAKVLFSAAQGRDTQAQLQCVHLTVHDGKFSASSCDGFRLTVASEDAAQDEPIDLLLPADAIKTMLAVFRAEAAHGLCVFQHGLTEPFEHCIRLVYALRRKEIALHRIPAVHAPRFKLPYCAE